MSLLKRYALNPILKRDENSLWESYMVFNPSVIYDGSLFRMLYTAGSGKGELSLGYAESKDGINFVKNPEPFFLPSENPDDFDSGTVDDPRVTYLDGKYYIVYAARAINTQEYAAGKTKMGPNGERWVTWRNNYRRVGLASTTDWKTVTRHGPLSSPHLSDANVALFPEKIGGKYVYLHRPTTATAWTLPMRYNPGAIWILFTDKVDYWCSDRRENPWDMVDKVDMPDDYLLIRPEYSWESDKVGGLGVPIPTDDGWLMFYHGVDRPGTYRLGMLLLDRDDPRKVLCRTREPIMEPETEMEKTGGYPGCIFPCANVVVGDEVRIYYGAGDQCICTASGSLKELLNHVKKNPVR